MKILEYPEVKLAIALGLGLLIGAERERRKAEQKNGGAAGIRTFALVSLTGGLASLFDNVVVLVMAGVFVGAATLAGYLSSHEDDRGLSTEFALFATFLLGALAYTKPTLATGAAIAVTAVLALRARLHKLVLEALTTEELLDALLFGVAAIVVLPLLPDRAMGPMGVFNPFLVWRLVVLIMGITGAGYVAQRIVGPRYGLAIAGLASGFVSSSATIGAMGMRAKDDETLERAAIAGACASTVATIVQMAILVGTASRATLGLVAIPLGLAGAVAVVYALFFAYRSARQPAPAASRGHAFELKSAIAFALAVTGVMFVSSAALQRYGEAGLFIATGAAGFADAHAPSASVAAVHAAGEIGEHQAAIAILVALTTNSFTKISLAFTAGSRRFALRVGAGIVLVDLAAWLGWLVTRP